MVQVMQLSASSLEESEAALDSHGGSEGLEEILQSDLSSGLSGTEADIAERKDKYGSNTFPSKEMDSVSVLFVEN